MKLLKNKKGVDYMVLMLPVVAIALSLLASNLLGHINSFDGMLGSHSVDLLKANDQATKDLLFLDLSADKAASEALQKLYANNGLFGISCGTQNGTALWNTNSRLCLSSINENYKLYLTQELNKYLKKRSTYDYYITDEYVYGIALNDWNYSVKGGNYYVKPSFKIKFENRINELENIRIKVKKMIDLCSNTFTEKSMLDNCVDRFILDGKNLLVEKSNQDNYYFFKVKTSEDLEEKSFSFAIFLPYTQTT